MAYEFHYTPTGTGVISGKEVLEQTEDAINDLGNTAISGVQEALDKAEQALTNSENAVDDAQTALNTANNAEGVAIQAQTDVSNLSGTVTNIGNRVTTAEGNITNLQGRMTTAEGNITNLQGRMTTAETNIGNLQTAVSTAQATANSAQQTATTARQQSYVFRYSSTALVASSTNSNTLLDNTDNLKVGDKVIDSSGVLFSITAIDTQNSTFTIGTALIDLAQDSDVVHKSGNETVAGIKNFTDYTYIRALNFTNEVASPSSSDSAIMPIVTTVTYTDQTASKSARVNLRITANGDKSLYPHENNQYALGLTSRKWSEVHGVTYYYGSSDTEFSQKFVTTDTNQGISANKNFKGLITTTPDSPLWTVNTNTTADITSLASNCIHIESRTAGSLSDLSGGAWYVAQIGTGCFFFRQNSGTDVRYKHFPTNVVSKLCLMSNNNKFISNLCPDTTNSYNLGDSTNKWATINGLEPSALGMPDLSNGIDISSYIDVSQVSTNHYTPPANGWISISVISSVRDSIQTESSSGFSSGVYACTNPNNTNEYIASIIVPCVKNDTVTIYFRSTANTSTIKYAKFFPCQGNV